jgi:hypothetical protein
MVADEEEEREDSPLTKKKSIWECNSDPVLRIFIAFEFYTLSVAIVRDNNLCHT